MNAKLFNVILVITGIGIIVCLLIVSITDLSAKESSLLGILLTILSFVASWMVSKHFADNSHKVAIEEVKEQHLSNLRTYALNAAEKVNNLSNELAKLSVYLQQELETDEEDENNNEELYMSAYERIESAIHIINTLKSVNDTYLSDWKGVIGEELDERMEEQHEREHELKTLVEKVEYILKSRPNEQVENQAEVFKISKQINDLRKELNLALNSVSGTFVRGSRSVTKAKKQDVTTSCPYCTNGITYKQRPKVSSVKFVDCSKCHQKSIARWDEAKGFILEKEAIKEEAYACPWCNSNITTNLSTIPHSRSTCTCSNCGGGSQIIRTATAFNIHPTSNIQAWSSTYSKVEISEETLELVRQGLPSQPWAKGVHKEVAEKLKIPLNVTKHHIQELIKRGIFKPQIDGVLYDPIKPS